MKKIIATMSFILIFPTILYAACPAPVGNVYTPVDASAARVQECIEAADAASGGTVNIPAGTVTWSTGVIKLVTKNLVLTGAGTDKTIINAAAEYSLALAADGSTSLTIKDMTIKATAMSFGHGMLNINGSSSSKLVKNVNLDLTGATGGRLLSWLGPGVISGCTFLNPTGVGQGIEIYGGAEGSSYYWSGNPSFGGNTGVLYIEGNTFNFTNGPGDGAFDAYAGAKIVFRYNTVIGTDIGWHGNDSSTSLHSAEIYKNNFSGGRPNFAINIRGGTAVIWGNTYGANYPPGFTISLYRSCLAMGRDGKVCNGGGTYDLNSDASGYRCYQQPGATGNDGVTQWPIIEWDNNFGTGTNNGGFGLNGNFLKPANGGIGTTCINYDMIDHVKEGRDYINHNTCVGVSSGFCTTWWDDVNKKAKNYTPYVYPHPLVTASMPAPPRNLQLGP